MQVVNAIMTCILYRPRTLGLFHPALFPAPSRNILFSETPNHKHTDDDCRNTGQKITDHHHSSGACRAEVRIILQEPEDGYAEYEHSREIKQQGQFRFAESVEEGHHRRVHAQRHSAERPTIVAPYTVLIELTTVLPKENSAFYDTMGID